MATQEPVPPPTDGTLRTLWERGLCATEARNDPRWLMDAHTVQKESERVRIAGELWKTVCSECPVWGMCLRWAVENEEEGVWAGTTKLQRRRIASSANGGMTMDLSDEEEH